MLVVQQFPNVFQSTLPRGSDQHGQTDFNALACISIHAPSRERRNWHLSIPICIKFQSTLPRGSDYRQCNHVTQCQNFNPRSLAGATCSMRSLRSSSRISIHAPSRERPPRGAGCQKYTIYFNPRSLAGATSAFAC